MPLTRKQAWRRLRVRHEAPNSKDEVNALGKRLSNVTPPMPPMPPKPLWYRRTPVQPPKCTDNGQRPRDARSKVHSPQRDAAPDNRRAPKQERDPSARKQKVSFVRVGSRVSFNTVVAAILIPSAKDLHAAARQELWWQETDYRDFRINFIQFMRSPPTLADGPEMIPVDIVAESAQASAMEEKMKEAAEDLQPVAVGDAIYENAQPDPQATVKDPCVRAWTVEGSNDAAEEGGIEAGQTRESVISAVPAASANVTGTYAATAAAEEASAAVEGNVDVDLAADTTASKPDAVMFSSTPLAFPDALAKGETSSDIDGSLAVFTPPPPHLPTSNSGECAVSDGGDSDDTTDDGVCWEDEQKRSARSEPCLSCDSTDCEEESRDSANVRIRRSFADLETTRGENGGARLHRSMTDSMAAAATFEGKGGHRCRPRALSLDGWFTCGLQNCLEVKPYDTYDHAGRLRDLVQVPPVPAFYATSSLFKADGELDLAASLQRLHLAVNVSVNNGNQQAEGQVGSNKFATGREEKEKL